MSPELVCMDGAVPAYTPDTPTGVISLVHLEKRQDFFSPPMLLPHHPEIEIGPIRMIVHGQNLLVDASIMQILCPIHNQIDNPSGLLMVQVLIDQIGTATRIDKMVKTDPRYICLLKKIEDPRYLTHIHAIYGETKANFEPRILTVPYPFHGIFEGPLFAPKLVIDRLHAI